MAAIPSQILGFRLFTGELINQIITICNNLSGNGASGATQNLAFNGTETITPQFVTAAGATQGTATAITKAFAIVNVATTNSNHGVKLPTAATGLFVRIANSASHGNKVYPAVGAQISSASTNVAIALTKNKQTLFTAVSATKWVAQAGA